MEPMDMDPTLNDEAAGLRVAMVSMNEMFIAAVGGGFTENQAIKFCVEFMKSANDEE